MCVRSIYTITLKVTSIATGERIRLGGVCVRDDDEPFVGRDGTFVDMIHQQNAIDDDLWGKTIDVG